MNTPNVKKRAIIAAMLSVFVENKYDRDWVVVYHELKEAQKNNAELPDEISPWVHYEDLNLSDLMDLVDDEIQTLEDNMIHWTRNIKSALIEIAIKGELPSDLNELDIHALAELAAQ